MRLPLWKACLEKMLIGGVEHGKAWPTEFFESELRSKRSDMQFNFDISEIRRELEKVGYYLSGRGQNGTQFVIIAAEHNKDVMANYNRAAFDSLRRGITLGASTRLELLSPEARQKHDAILERMQTRLALMQRSMQIKRALEKSAPKQKLIS